MKRVFGRFWDFRSRLSLGWKLTLSYTLVTVTALLVVELALFVGAFALYFLGQPSNSELSADMLSDTVAPRLQRHLSRHPPDLGGIHDVLWDQILLSPGESEEDHPPVAFEPGRLPDAYTLFVLDGEGRVIDAAPRVEGFPEGGERLDARSLPGLEPVLAAALAGREDTARLYANPDGGGGIAAAPVKDAAGRVVGVVVETVPPLGVGGPLLWLIPFLLIALGLTVTVGILGTIFGFVTARGLTRRLRRLTHASESWSRGEFSVASGDRSGDEIGQLSGALDHMTTQIENLMQTRRLLFPPVRHAVPIHFRPLLLRGFTLPGQPSRTWSRRHRPRGRERATTLGRLRRDDRAEVLGTRDDGA